MAITALLNSLREKRESRGNFFFPVSFLLGKACEAELGGGGSEFLLFCNKKRKSVKKRNKGEKVENLSRTLET